MWSRRRGDSDEPAPRIKGCRRVRRHPGTGDDRSRQPPRLSWISVCTTWLWLSMMSRCALAWFPCSPPGRPDTTDRKHVEEGKRVSVRVDFVGGRIIQKT